MTTTRRETRQEEGANVTFEEFDQEHWWGGGFRPLIVKGYSTIQYAIYTY